MACHETKPWGFRERAGLRKSRRAPPQAGVGQGGWVGGASLISACAWQQLSHPTFIASMLTATSPAALSRPLFYLFIIIIV